ncbi:MAG: CoB--CoM heterodisulfide reductase iron-sulfur subunit B family protein [bacterium]|nr:CoB--CoM heterodisulfide reductase iron-sulfur subunit B family protein [bacterium]
MTSFSYYPGCSLHATAREYDESIRAVAGVLGFELREIEDWCCCGATPAHAIDPDAAHLLGDWNLARATATGAGPLLTGCASCYSRLRAAGAELRAHPASAPAAAARVGGTIDPDLEILHVAQLLARPEVREAVAAKVTRPLNGLKIACYYGCLLTRPRGENAFDDAEAPTLLEDLVRLAGGEPVDWPLRLDCCGASLALPEPAIVRDLSGKLLAMAHARGAQAMMVACPLCHANLDMTQPAIAKQKKFDFEMPVLYVTQVIGLALGIEPRALGLHRHIVPVRVDALIPAREANHV